MLRLWPLLVMLAVLVLGYALGLHRLLGWESLVRHHAALRGLVEAHPVLTAAGFVGIYVAAVSVSFPGTVFLTMTGGLLFGTVIGATLTVVGATSGSIIIFLVVRGTVAPLLAARTQPFIQRFRASMERDAFACVIALRLIPVVPFWLVNLSAAVLRVRLASFAGGTFLGIIPPTTIFSSVGAGMAAVLAAGERPDPTLILSPPVLLPLLGLAVLVLLPVAWREWKGRACA